MKLMTDNPDYGMWVVFLIGGLVLAGYFIRTVLSAFRKKPEETPILSPLSAFAVLSFLSGLCLMGLLLAAAMLYLCQDYDILLGLDRRDVSRVSLARTIVLYCTVAPALAAIGFALAARTSVKESDGALRGKAYYRAAFHLSL